MIRRAFRFFFPRRKHPRLDAEITPAMHDELYRDEYLSAIINERDEFVLNRFDEGLRWREVLGTPHARTLDVGGGNGAIEFAFAASEAFVVSVDALWNETARAIGVNRVIADAAALPFKRASFATILCLETIEHLAESQRVASEIARVAADAAILLVTTPPKWRYALAPDPHFGIRFLTLFPPKMQRAIASRRGFSDAHHFVDRIYRSTAQVARVFRDFTLTDVLSRSRAPRRWFWDALVFERKNY